MNNNNELVRLLREAADELDDANGPSVRVYKSAKDETYVFMEDYKGCASIMMTARKGAWIKVSGPGEKALTGIGFTLVASV